MTAHCDMAEECTAPVTHIGEKGWIYCTQHALDRRRSWERSRKMRPWELRWIAEGRPLPSYKPMPMPKEASK